MMEMRGVITALVTPFAGGEVDFEKLRELVNRQIDGGVTGIVPVGTTGESPTLTYEEHLKVIKAVVDEADGRCLVVAGTGANSTAEAIELTKTAKEHGADATLQVCPYYNKPTQEGLFRHFTAVAEQGGLPVVLYSIPGRCGIAIAESTIARLSNNPMIVALKEAGGSADRVSAILDLCDITILSGDDSLTLPMMAVGATGVISVASNVIPAEMVKMVEAFAAGDVCRALDLHRQYYCLFRDLFIETNPVPVKAAMAMLGQINEEYRLPLCEMNTANREVLANSLKRCGVLR